MGVARLLAATAALDAPRVFEKSVKIDRRGISTDRGLVSMDRRAIYPGPKAQLQAICADLGAPDCTVLFPYLSSASAIHFGADGEIGKCYLEFAPADAPEADLVFLALKWHGDDQRLNRYSSVSDLSHTSKRNMIRDLLHDPTVADVMGKCLDLAQDGDPDGNAVVLRVTEEGSTRVSLDISVADAKQTLGDAARLLAPLAAFQGCGLRPWLDENRSARFGHIAAGLDARGEVFVTLYYGAEQL